MSKKIFFQRDSFIYEIYKKAKKNKNIFFLSADFGAPALDIFRKDLPKQFIHTGISEQNMIDVAMGMSLKEKLYYLCYGTIYSFKSLGTTQN